MLAAEKKLSFFYCRKNYRAKYPTTLHQSYTLAKFAIKSQHYI